jgi:hypothetical protein
MEPPKEDTNPAALPAKRVALEDPIDKRVKLLGGVYTEPLDSKYARSDIHQAALVYATELQNIFKRNKVDTGRAIAAIDAVSQSYRIAVDAVMLPYVRTGDDK